MKEKIKDDIINMLTRMNEQNLCYDRGCDKKGNAMLEITLNINRRRTYVNQIRGNTVPKNIRHHIPP